MLFILSSYKAKVTIKSIDTKTITHTLEASDKMLTEVQNLKQIKKSYK